MTSGGSNDSGGTDGEMGGASGGEESGTGGTTDCCLAVPTCNGNDQQLESEHACPDGATCYSNTLCCDTVWCVASEPATCSGSPTCFGSEIQVKTCPEDQTCVERRRCGMAVTCTYAGTICYPKNDWRREYHSHLIQTCELASFSCPEHTTPFFDECGCGCEQAAECPQSSSCMLSMDDDELEQRICSGSGECPYSDLAPF